MRGTSRVSAREIRSMRFSCRRRLRAIAGRPGPADRCQPPRAACRRRRTPRAGGSCSQPILDRAVLAVVGRSSSQLAAGSRRRGSRRIAWACAMPASPARGAVRRRPTAKRRAAGSAPGESSGGYRQQQDHRVVGEQQSARRRKAGIVRQPRPTDGLVMALIELGQAAGPEPRLEAIGHDHVIIKLPEASRAAAGTVNNSRCSRPWRRKNQ